MAGLGHLSYQSWVTHLPISKGGGLGIRHQVDISPIADIGTLEQTVPHFTGERGVCYQVAHMARNVVTDERETPSCSSHKSIGGLSEPSSKECHRMEAARQTLHSLPYVPTWSTHQPFLTTVRRGSVFSSLHAGTEWGSR